MIMIKMLMMMMRRLLYEAVYLTHQQCTDIGPTSPNTGPVTPGA